MPKLIEAATVIQSVGNKPKRIEEFSGRVNTGDDTVSVARMSSPEGWLEPGQTPAFREITIVFSGSLHVESAERHDIVQAGQGIVCEAGEWVRYSTPEPGGAEYVAICLPAFSPDTVNRDDS